MGLSFPNYKMEELDESRGSFSNKSLPLAPPISHVPSGLPLTADPLHPTGILIFFTS